MPRSRKTTTAKRGSAKTTPASSSASRGRPRTNDAISDADLLKYVKRGMGQTAIANELGLSLSQVPMLRFNQAQVEAGIYSEVRDTESNVLKLYEDEGNRIELIAARMGITVKAVKDLVGGPDEFAKLTRATKKANGNGDNGDADGGDRKTTSRKRSSAKTGSTKRTSKRSSAAAAASTPTRSRTRAARRAAQSGNPS